MAKHSLVRRSAPVIVMAPPRRRGRVRRAARAVGRGVRSVGRRTIGGRAQLPAMGIGIGGLIAGYLDGKGYLNKLPQLGGSKIITLGIVGYAAQRFLKNKYAREAGIAMMAAAAFDFGRVQAGGTSGFEDIADAGGGMGGGMGYPGPG